jgi:hypothetical protein
VIRKRLEPEELKEKLDAEMNNEENADENAPVKVPEEIEGDVLIKRRKLQFFKFWPKPQLQSAWRSYLSAGE